MNNVTLVEPRSITRLAFDAAIRGAATEGAKQELINALNWYELKWEAQERQRQAQQAAQQQEPPKPTPPSAVETHGIESEQAQEKRDQRRAKRLAEQAARAEKEQPQKGAGGDEGTPPADGDNEKE